VCLTPHCGTDDKSQNALVLRATNRTEMSARIFVVRAATVAPPNSQLGQRGPMAPARAQSCHIADVRSTATVSAAAAPAHAQFFPTDLARNASTVTGAAVPAARINTIRGTAQTDIPQIGIPQTDTGPHTLAVMNATDAMASGSKRQIEVSQDLAEAVKIAHWLSLRPLGCIKDSPSGIYAHARRDTLIAILSKVPKPTLCRLRRVVERLDEWASKPSGSALTEQLYPLSSDIILQFISDQQEAARISAPLGTFKATVAPSLAKSLKKAGGLFRLNIADGVFDDPRLALLTSRPPSAIELEPDVAHMSMSLFGSFLELALGEFSQQALGRPPRVTLSEYALLYARSFCCAIAASLRTIEAERARLESFTADDAFVVIRVAGGKPKRMTEVLPFVTRIPLSSLPLGMALWLPGFADRMAPFPFLFPQFGTARGFAGRIMHATTWGAKAVATRAHISRAFDDLASLPPALLSPSDLESAGTTLYAIRHLLPDVARQYGFRKEDRDELGRWEASPLERDNTSILAEPDLPRSPQRKKRRAGKRSSSNLYSRGEAALSRELIVRNMVLSRITQAFGDPSSWHERVPAQRGEPPSFVFLPGCYPDQDLDPIDSDPE
jgi:hypothetical protein